MSPTGTISDKSAIDATTAEIDALIKGPLWAPETSYDVAKDRGRRSKRARSSWRCSSAQGGVRCADQGGCAAAAKPRCVKAGSIDGGRRRGDETGPEAAAAQAAAELAAKKAAASST